MLDFLVEQAWGNLTLPKNLPKNRKLKIYQKLY